MNKNNIEETELDVSDRLKGTVCGICFLVLWALSGFLEGVPL